MSQQDNQKIKKINQGCSNCTLPAVMLCLSCMTKLKQAVKAGLNRQR